MIRIDQLHVRGSAPKAVIVILAFAIGIACWCGCGHDARLAGQKVRDVQVKAVNMYGQTLDAQATPEQVAFAALQAIREDVLATTPQAREAALDKEFDLAAADEIQSRNHSSMGRDEFIYNVVYRWAPTISYYVADFPTTMEQAQKRFGPKKLTPLPAAKSEGTAKECEIPIEVADPNGDPNARVIILIWLNQDHGFWRVMHFGFDSSRRKLEVTSGTNPTPSVQSGG